MGGGGRHRLGGQEAAVGADRPRGRRPHGRVRPAPRPAACRPATTRPSGPGTWPPAGKPRATPRSGTASRSLPRAPPARRSRPAAPTARSGCTRRGQPGTLPDWADAPVLAGHAHGITAMSFDRSGRLAWRRRAGTGPRASGTWPPARRPPCCCPGRRGRGLRRRDLARPRRDRRAHLAGGRPDPRAPPHPGGSHMSDASARQRACARR